MNTPVKGAQAFSKSINVLRVIANCETPPTIGVLLNLTGLPRGTLNRIVQALIAENLVLSKPEKTYILGPGLISLAAIAAEHFDLRSIGHKKLAALRDHLDETVHLAALVGDQLIYTAKYDSRHAVRIASTVGTSAKLHASAIGKAYLSQLPVEERSALVESLQLPRLTDYTITSREQLVSQLNQAAMNGHAVIDQESDLDIKCIGVAIKQGGRPIGGVSVSIPLYRIKDNIQHYLEPIHECKRWIEEKIGH